ncbi:hypothetical protein CHS0354_019800 [Potamilus streckersoni]|uniref:Poly [ADP-ribose] polymerase n=1 Tax=Potamilus streckersoni TaxID=2493646 RepID=A0AAE0W2T3_9BIVA|nr:hypothetical protein CHS0354_019800 [Potamilus streckersoni]
MSKVVNWFKSPTEKGNEEEAAEENPLREKVSGSDHERCSDFFEGTEWKRNEDVVRVLQKRPLLFLKKQISVEEYIKEGEKEPPCRTIEVHGFTETAMLEMYFGNTEQSGGGKITSVKITDGVALLTFADQNVCKRVLQRKHKIDGSELQVSVHYESLGHISEDHNRSSFKSPKPVKLEGLEFAKMQFLMKSEANRTSIEKQLQDCFTVIQWPQTETDCTTLTCALTCDIQDCRKKAVFWPKQAEQNLNDVLKVISVNDIKVFQEIFETVLQNLQNLVISNPDGVALFVKKAEFSIQVVGYKAIATLVVSDIENIIKMAEADFDRHNKQTKESLTNLKHYQLKLLLAVKYPSKMEQKFNRLKVKINLNKKMIVFKGFMEDIRSAQVAMYEVVHNAAVSQLSNISEGRLCLYKSKQVKDYIVAKLKSKKLVGVWEVVGTDLNIYANSNEVVIQSTDIIDDSVKEYQKDLEPPLRFVVQSQQWNDNMINLDKQYQGKLHVVLALDFSKLCLYFTDDISGPLIKTVNYFLSQHRIFEKKVTCKSGTIRLIQRRKRDELDKIARDLAHYYVQIAIQLEVGFRIWGTQDGISHASFRLQKLIDMVKHRDHELQKPGIAGYMKGKGKDHIVTVENQIPCVILAREQEQYSFEENEKEMDNFVMPKMPVKLISNESSVHGNISIKVVKGEMAMEKVDVIVNTTSYSLDLTNGTVSQSLLKTGGQILQEECKMKYPNGIKDGDIAVTRGGKLDCQIVCHGALKSWCDETTNKKMLHELMKKCLDECEKGGFTRISFPALGTGHLNYPRNFVAKEMFQHIYTYSRDNPASSIKEVRFVVYRKDESTIKAFASEQQKWSSRGTRSGQYSLTAEECSIMPKVPVKLISNELSVHGNISIKVVKGEMANEEVDVIVNTTSYSLDLSNGAVSQSLLKKGGQILQEECKMKYLSGIKDGDIAVTRGGNLDCQIVCHGALKSWCDETTNKKILHELMKKCLDECEKGGFTSIAFPALGTGILNYPRHIVAKEMFQHIYTYSRDNPSSSIKEVRFVVYQKDQSTIKAFASEQQKWSSRETSHTAEDSIRPDDEDQVSDKLPLKSLQLRKAVAPINTVWIDVYAWEKSDLDDAISKLNYLLDNDFSADGFALPDIKTFNSEQKKQISVKESEEEEEKDPPNLTIEVHGLTERLNEDWLKMYFENSKRSGGGDVSGIEITDGIAFITFADEDIARRVAGRQHVVSGCTLDVKLYELTKCKSAQNLSWTTSNEPEESVTHCTIEVGGVTKRILETVQLYFENKKRSGGDEIVKFEYKEENKMAYITYKSEEVARRVAEHQHVVLGCTLDVILYKPPKHKSAQNLSWTTSNELEESVAHCTIQVRGVTKRILETVQLYFENKKRSGGDEIVKFEYKKENKMAYITYESEEVAKRVVSHGLHKVEGHTLEVKLCMPPPPRYEDRDKIGQTPGDFHFDRESSEWRIEIREIFLDEFCKERMEEFLSVKRNDLVMENLLQVILANNNKEALYIIMAYISKKWKEDFGDNTMTVWLGLDHRGGKTGEEVLVCFHSADIVSKFSKFLGLPVIYRRFDETEMEPLENRLQEKYQRVSFDKNDAATIKYLICEHGEHLFKIHNNLEAISASSVKSGKNGIIEQTSILLYCRLKGVIPYGEDFFPEKLGLDGKWYPTDIREGFFSLGMNPAQRQLSNPHPHFFNSPLRMGCSIGALGSDFAGTLGPFVRLDTNDLGFLTCAHVLGINSSLTQPSVMQPADSESGLSDGTRTCGTFIKEKFDSSAKIGVDAALVRIDQKNRNVDPGGFVWLGSHQLLSAGFSGSKSPSFEDGMVITNPDFEQLANKRVYKFGRTTGLTQGLFVLDGAMLKVHKASLSLPEGMPIPYGHFSNSFIMKGQFLVQKVGNDQFFSSGDSGAGVYVVKRKRGENKLALVGIAIGSITSGECAMTPIGSVLEALGLKESSIITEAGMETHQ